MNNKKTDEEIIHEIESRDLISATSKKIGKGLIRFELVLGKKIDEDEDIEHNHESNQK